MSTHQARKRVISAAAVFLIGRAKRGAVGFEFLPGAHRRAQQRFREAPAEFDVAAAKLVAANHVAAAIFAELPDTVRLDLHESDQSGWTWDAGTIYDADGAGIGDG